MSKSSATHLLAIPIIPDSDSDLKPDESHDRGVGEALLSYLTYLAKRKGLLGFTAVTKLRASDGANLGTFATGDYPCAIAFDGANIWVVNGGNDSVSKF